ncbi:hypothetical protein [Actinomadura sp. NPDC000600]|uniref:hypothetical protein n=1 Tax=Actinomadura sp. NPDC000600 TaxID=3154262 RepID=UPI0033996C74
MGGSWPSGGSPNHLFETLPHQPVPAEKSPTEMTPLTLSDAIVIVQKIPVDWRGRIAEQSVRQIGGKLWAELLQHRSIGLCHPLAQTARELLAIKAEISQLPGEAAAAAARSAGAPLVVQKIAKRLASDLGITTTIEQKLAATAHSVRILGVFVCEIAGVVPSCECLKDLVAERVSREEFEKKLWYLVEPSMSV